MNFLPLEVSGAFLIEPEPIPDERGFFARLWCQREFEERGLLGRIVQCSQSFNAKKGTLRGLHYQLAPHAEVKVVRCMKGAIYDVILDLRPASPTFRKFAAITLTSENRRDGLRAGGVRPRVPDARGRDRGPLPDLGASTGLTMPAASGGTIRRSTFPGRRGRRS